MPFGASWLPTLLSQYYYGSPLETLPTQTLAPIYGPKMIYQIYLIYISILIKRCFCHCLLRSLMVHLAVCLIISSVGRAAIVKCASVCCIRFQWVFSWKKPFRRLVWWRIVLVDRIRSYWVIEILSLKLRPKCPSLELIHSTRHKYRSGYKRVDWDRSMRSRESEDEKKSCYEVNCYRTLLNGRSGQTVPHISMLTAESNINREMWIAQPTSES